METKFSKFYQLGNGGQLIFERDLDSLSELLGRPHPEFLGAQLPGPPGGDLQWLVTADLRGSIEAPTSGRIQFSVRENNWLDGLARAMHEALARLCALSVNKIQGTRFAHYARRDFMGMPMEMPSHPELRRQVENLDFLLHDRQQELDNARELANQNRAIADQKAQTFALLVQDRQSLRRQRAKKDRTIARLRKKVADLEKTVKEQEAQLAAKEEEEEGEDIQGDMDSYLSNDDDFLEEDAVDFYTDDEDSDFIDDE